MKRLKSNRLSHLAYGEEFPTPKQKKANKEFEEEQAKAQVEFEEVMA